MTAKSLNRVAVVVPAYQAATTISSCLEAILNSSEPIERIVVVDDGSKDNTGGIAKEFGVQVIRNDFPLRPARARNIGVEACDSPIVVFVDSDVVVAKDAIARLVAELSDTSVGGAIGSYDLNPKSQSLLSNYRNLLHYFTHQTAPREAETFWSGLGAVRRERYQELGGLDPSWEDIEDVEFGLRLRASGDRIILVPEAQSTHLKKWTLRSMYRTDLWGRAVPWSRLILSGRISPRAMNASTVHRLAAAGVAMVCLSLPLSLVSPYALWVSSIGLALYLGANVAFWNLLYQVGGWRLTLVGMLGHAVHYLAAISGYAYARIVSPPAR